MKQQDLLVTALLHRPAVWDDTRKQMAGKGPIQTGEEHIAIIEVDGVEFRTWLPKSRKEADQMNAAAAKIVARCSPVPQIILE